MIFKIRYQVLNPAVGFQIMEALKLLSGTKGEKDLTGKLLKLVGILIPQISVDVYPHQLSGGMSQRVMIAIAVLAD